jgi:hypothetical protein
MANAKKFEDLYPKPPEVKGPTPGQVIVQVALEAYKQGRITEHVLVAPHVYPDLIAGLGKEVDFMEMYGRKSFSIQGLTCNVRREAMGSLPWAADHWFELLTAEDMMTAPIHDTLIMKIARTWESCNQQCQQGYACPLLTEVGTNLEMEVMDACTALTEIETQVGALEEELELTAIKFEQEKTNAGIGCD